MGAVWNGEHQQLASLLGTSAALGARLVWWPVYLYEPNHRLATDLTNTVIYQDVCAKGCYVNTVDANDVDVPYGDVLTFAEASGPAWLTVVPNGAIFGSPTGADVGASAFRARVTDSEGLSATASFTVQVEPSTPPRLWAEADRERGLFELWWPTSYVSFVLQWQNNAQGAGLTRSWSPVAGAASNHWLLPLDSQIGSAFFRLAKTP
jgi:hypothetical protein